MISNREISLQVLITEREAYIAENKDREMRGEYIAWTSKDFFSIAKAMEDLKEK